MTLTEDGKRTFSIECGANKAVSYDIGKVYTLLDDTEVEMFQRADAGSVVDFDAAVEKIKHLSGDTFW
jgi:hypothetical protein